MKINITKKEYGLMLDMISLASWVMNSYAMGEDDHPEHEVLRRKIYSYFKEMDAEDKIEFASELDDYFELAGYEEYIHEKFIQPYEEKFFWDELIERLAKRDVINDIGKEQFGTMKAVERLRLIEKARKQYENEFEKQGLEYLCLKSKTGIRKKV